MFITDKDKDKKNVHRLYVLFAGHGLGKPGSVTAAAIIITETEDTQDSDGLPSAGKMQSVKFYFYLCRFV